MMSCASLVILMIFNFLRVLAVDFKSEHVIKLLMLHSN